MVQTIENASQSGDENTEPGERLLLIGEMNNLCLKVSSRMVAASQLPKDEEQPGMIHDMMSQELPRKRDPTN